MIGQKVIVQLPILPVGGYACVGSGEGAASKSWPQGVRDLYTRVSLWSRLQVDGLRHAIDPTEVQYDTTSDVRVSTGTYDAAGMGTATIETACNGTNDVAEIGTASISTNDAAEISAASISTNDAAEIGLLVLAL
ncbi:hypothetical protein RRG08_032414 [Elysia crispata]|uniref:Uncharacterized protein n=1 Tax=Elysia crispata TaxID=231223 RepID=A0AAE0XPA7_9GAST|nr:hypothetical protein RRG08_032414 [Elysia crispata]